MALAIFSNALTLLDQKDAWIILSIVPEGLGARQLEQERCKLTPEGRFASGKHDSKMVKFSDIIVEYTLLSVQVDLVRRDPELLHSCGEHWTALPDCEELTLNIEYHGLSVLPIHRLMVGPIQLI